MMRFRTTLLLLGICVVLGGYVIWSGRSSNTSTVGSTPTPAPNVVTVNTADVDTIAIRDTNGNEVETTRSGTTWMLTKPSAVAADSAAIGNTLSSLAVLNATQVITPPSTDITPYGLGTPIYVIQLRKGANIVVELHVGDKTPTGSATYVQPVGATNVYLVDDPAIQTAVGWLTTPPTQPTPLPTIPPATPPPVTTATAKP